MSIFSRLIQVIRSNLNALLNNAEDPSKMLEQTLLDLDAAYRKSKDQVARSIADQKRLEQNHKKELAEVDKWHQNAIKAVEKGDDELARQALARKAEHAGFAQQYEHELAAHSANVEKLKDGLRELEHKISEIRRKKNLLISKQKRVEAQKEIYQALEGINQEGALDTISRMESKIDEMSALADARQDLNKEFSGDALENKIQALGSDSPTEVDQELLALKEQLKLENKA